MMTIFVFMLTVLIILAAWDITVGVSNDAVNFLNAGFGSKVASRKVIIIVASLGVLVGATFSSGMMEVARKGIFNPTFFTMPELLLIFLAVMLTDVLLLDVFNTLGLPTSTTVSIVFSLMGGAVVISLLKIFSLNQDLSLIWEYVNAKKSLVIVSGILSSVFISFIAGAVVQFFSRILFTFDYKARLKYYGGLWGGLGMAVIIYFMVAKGAKGISFLGSDQVQWISQNSLTIFLWSFAGSTIILQGLIHFFQVNVLKFIVLAGTFALAMSFAGNDLVNFIGVPLAGWQAYEIAMKSTDPLNILMSGLSGEIHSSTWLLLLSGLIMVLTIWFSKKIKTVSKTELSLGQQDEGIDKYNSSTVSRIMVRGVSSGINKSKKIVPLSIRESVAKRIERQKQLVSHDETPSFDLVRACVNLIISSAVISYGTSMKLPLSTTYITFMVSMGSSFADRAWGRDSAAYRVNGVLMVISGWFMTALSAFVAAGTLAFILSFHQYALIPVLALTLYVIFRNHVLHQNLVSREEDLKIFNLSKGNSLEDSIHAIYQHNGILIKHLAESQQLVEEALYHEDLRSLYNERKKLKVYQRWANIIIANSFKTLRQQGQEEHDPLQSIEFTKTIGLIQELSSAHRDFTLRAYHHVSNHHSPLLPPQRQELSLILGIYRKVMFEACDVFQGLKTLDMLFIRSQLDSASQSIHSSYTQQVLRIQKGESKTRLSILYFGMVGNARKSAKRVINLLELYKDSFHKL